MKVTPLLVSSLLIVDCAGLMQTGPSHGRSFMECGDSVSLCGVLTLESGYGHGHYSHMTPVVHGLWPETGHFGSSRCMKPLELEEPHELASCFVQPGESRTQLLKFQKHEWDKHGRCSGARGAQDFLEQVCRLAAQPLEALQRSRQAGFDLTRMVDSMRNNGFPVYSVTEKTGEIQLSVCADALGRWRLAPTSRFKQVCGQSPAQKRQRQWADKAAYRHLKASACVPNTHGPSCNADGDCIGASGCLRCASSGFCTDVPLHDHR